MAVPRKHGVAQAVNSAALFFERREQNGDPKINLLGLAGYYPKEVAIGWESFANLPDHHAAVKR
jgi:hypothetical protein